MKLKNEYSILILSLYEIVNCRRLSQRKKLAVKFINQLNQFNSHIQELENRIDSIAEQACSKKQMSQAKRDFLAIDTMFDALTEIQRMQKGEFDGNKDTRCSGIRARIESNEKSDE